MAHDNASRNKWIFVTLEMRCDIPGTRRTLLITNIELTVVFDDLTHQRSVSGVHVLDFDIRKHYFSELHRLIHTIETKLNFPRTPFTLHYHIPWTCQSNKHKLNRIFIESKKGCTCLSLVRCRRCCCHSSSSTWYRFKVKLWTKCVNKRRELITSFWIVRVLV